MKFTKLPPDTFQKLVLNAGILVDAFTPATGVIGNLMGATTGGITFNSNPTYTDFGEDVDNCPNNTMELKRIDQFDPAMSGTFLTLTATVVKDLIGAADIAVSDATHVIPRDHLIEDDFKEVWWIGDYSDINNDGDTGSSRSAGFLAIHLMNRTPRARWLSTSTAITAWKTSKKYRSRSTARPEWPGPDRRS